MSALPKAYLYGDTGRHVVVAGVLHELVEMTVPASLVDAVMKAMDWSEPNPVTGRPKNYLALVSMVKFGRSWNLKDAKDLVDMAVDMAKAKREDPEVALQRRDDAREPILPARMVYSHPNPTRGMCGRMVDTE